MMFSFRFSIVLVLLLFVFYSCDEEQQASVVDVKDEEFSPNNEQSPLNDDLHDLLLDYMKEVDANFNDKEWLYYSIYFFQKDNRKYCTLWTFTAYPNASLFNAEAKECSHCYYKIDKRNVVLIFDREQDYMNLFSVSDECIKQAQSESEKNYEGDIYDGNEYVRTYEIMFNKAVLDFVRQDEVVSPYGEWVKSN